MRFLTRTMTILVVIPLMMGGLARAQEVKTYTISGSATLPGVMMKGLPGDPLTGADGKYSVTVSHDWSGPVTPTKEGFNFIPKGRHYMTLVKDMTTEDYAPTLVKFTISGSVATEGVIMKGLPGLPIANKDGKYRATVDYGWSGTVTPTKAGYVFEPPSRTYPNVKVDFSGQDYWPTQIGPAAMLARSGGRKALVIPADDVKLEDLTEIKADMQVMSHILDKRFKQTRRTQSGLFTDFGPFFGRDNRETEATYLQGYGILFSMEVNFTFSPPTEPVAQETEETSKPVDSTWQQARQEVFQPGAPQRSGMSEPTEERGHRMVEELTKELIGTLKHAANIRALQPDEWIILTIIGDAGYGGGMGGMMGGGYGGGMMGGMMGGMGGMMGGMGGYGGGSSSGGGGGYGGTASGGYRGGMGTMEGRMSGMSMRGMRMGVGMGMGGMGMGGFGGMGTSSATVLTIRAKKSDVDAFAKGELDFEKFQEKVKTVIY